MDPMDRAAMAAHAVPYTGLRLDDVAAVAALIAGAAAVVWISVICERDLRLVQ